MGVKAAKPWGVWVVAGALELRGREQKAQLPKEMRKESEGGL